MIECTEDARSHTADDRAHDHISQDPPGVDQQRRRQQVARRPLGIEAGGEMQARGDAGAHAEAVQARRQPKQQSGNKQRLVEVEHLTIRGRRRILSGIFTASLRCIKPGLRGRLDTPENGW